MTKAGKLEIAFASFKKEVEARLSALEKANTKPSPTTKKKKNDEIVIETKNDDIVASDAE